MVTLNDLMGRIAGCFGRIEPRRAATAYVRGLLSNLERKNCWNLAEHAGLTGPQAIRRLPRTVRWDADAVRGCVIEQLGQDGVLIVDETGFLKKGVRSAGVQRNTPPVSGLLGEAHSGPDASMTVPASYQGRSCSCPISMVVLIAAVFSTSALRGFTCPGRGRSACVPGPGGRQIAFGTCRLVGGVRRSLRQVSGLRHRFKSGFAVLCQISAWKDNFVVLDYECHRESDRDNQE